MIVVLAVLIYSIMNAMGEITAKKPVTLLTFDVDGTLVQGSTKASAGSIHSRSFNHAVSKVYGGGDCGDHPLDVIPSENYHGSTDGLISLNIAKFGLKLEPSHTFPRLQEVFEEMFKFVQSHTDEEVSDGIAPLPGVIDKLEQLALEKAEGNVLCGLVTGNVEGIARKKMRAVGVLQTNALSLPSTEQVTGRWGSLEDDGFLGGFGSDYCSGDLDDKTRNYKDRGEQILICIRRAQSILPNTHKITRVVHIGDAPADVKAVTHARESLAKDICLGVIAVGTGKWGVSELETLFDKAVPDYYEPICLADGMNDPAFVSHCLKSSSQ